MPPCPDSPSPCLAMMVPALRPAQVRPPEAQVHSPVHGSQTRRTPPLLPSPSLSSHRPLLPPHFLSPQNCPVEVPLSVATGWGVSGACSGRRRRSDGGRAIGPNPQMLGPPPPPPMGGEEALPGVPCPKSTCLQPGAISIWADQVLHPGHREGTTRQKAWMGIKDRAGRY